MRPDRWTIWKSTARWDQSVVARAATLGLPVIAGLASRALRGEAQWRDARWTFLREVAATVGAPVATAHTRDDQVETVALRLLPSLSTPGNRMRHLRIEVRTR